MGRLGDPPRVFVVDDGATHRAGVNRPPLGLLAADGVRGSPGGSLLLRGADPPPPPLGEARRVEAVEALPQLHERLRPLLHHRRVRTHGREAKRAIAVGVVQLRQRLERRLAQQREHGVPYTLVGGIAQATHHRRLACVVQALGVGQGQRGSAGGVVVVEDDAERHPRVLPGLVVERPRGDVQRDRRVLRLGGPTG